MALSLTEDELNRLKISRRGKYGKAPGGTYPTKEKGRCNKWNKNR